MMCLSVSGSAGSAAVTYQGVSMSPTNQACCTRSSCTRRSVHRAYLASEMHGWNAQRRCCSVINFWGRDGYFEVAGIQGGPARSDQETFALLTLHAAQPLVHAQQAPVPQQPSTPRRLYPLQTLATGLCGLKGSTAAPTASTQH